MQGYASCNARNDMYSGVHFQPYTALLSIVRGPSERQAPSDGQPEHRQPDIPDLSTALVRLGRGTHARLPSHQYRLILPSTRPVREPIRIGEVQLQLVVQIEVTTIDTSQRPDRPTQAMQVCMQRKHREQLLSRKLPTERYIQPRRRADCTDMHACDHGCGT